MDTDTARTIACTYTADEIARQIATFEAAKADEDAEGIASLNDAIATLNEAKRLQG